MIFTIFLFTITLGIYVHPIFLLASIYMLLKAIPENHNSRPPTTTFSSAPRAPHKLKPSSYIPTNHSDPRTPKFQARKKIYMNSKAWRDKKNLVLARDSNRCQICNSTSNLAVHHMRDYILIPYEPISSLITLCRTCHQRQHDAHDPLRSYEDYARWDHKI